MYNLKNQKITNSNGLNFIVSENGSINCIEINSIQISLLKSHPISSGYTNIYLRKRTPELKAVHLLGPDAPGSFLLDENKFIIQGLWEEIAFTCRLLLSEKTTWYWDIQVENQSSEKIEIDLIYIQDVGLTPAGMDLNTYYVSQYIDRTVLETDQYGNVVCCRQNCHGPDCFPWLMLGSTKFCNSVSTDAIQFFGPEFRETGIPSALQLSELPGQKTQELSMIALQEKPFELAPGEKHQSGFFGIFIKDHQPTSPDDLELVKPAIEEYNNLKIQPIPLIPKEPRPANNLFISAPLLKVDDLNEQELNNLFSKDRRHPEIFDNKLLSFFYGNTNHVVLRQKELIVERPHAHIMKTGKGFTPNESIATTTTYMSGVFNSHITQGNTSFNKLLTICTDSLNLVCHTGQRIFIKIKDKYYLLGVPSAFEIGLNSCRWFYKFDSALLEIRSWTAPEYPEINLDINILKGDSFELLISSEIDHETFKIKEASTDLKEIIFIPTEKSETVKYFPGGSFKMCFYKPEDILDINSDEFIYLDGISRSENFVVIKTSPIKRFSLQINGELIKGNSANITDMNPDERWIRDCDNAVKAWNEISGNLSMEIPEKISISGINKIQEIMPWYYHNWSIHYLTPYGLEQYVGAAWGSRDVCQGPFELLLCFERYTEARKVLSILFSNQNTDGNWPQWWMFDRYHSIRAGDAHGDIVFWPILALSEYVKAANDIAFMDEILPFYCKDGKTDSEKGTIFEHIDRSIKRIKSRLIADTALVDYEEGDWNDSMQPADQKLKHRLISSWTVCLCYQALTAYTKICRHAGKQKYADELDELCSRIKNDFNRLLIQDNIIAGFGLMEDNDQIKLLLHPTDSATNIQYRLLPMIRGIISGIFSPEQANCHLEVIEKHLLGPDGARLMNRPPKYRGGLQQYFQRAESSPYFGREIGLMYVHAHLRYAEALAHTGQAKKFLKALYQAIPIKIQDIVPTADIRQSNCYYSSSDADFPNRYEVDRNYDNIKKNKVILKGGWRIYSSGSGIYTRIIVSLLLGIRHNFGKTIFDPVLSHELNGLRVKMTFRKCKVEFLYKISGNNEGIQKIIINGNSIDFDRESNPFRMGGVIISDSKLEKILDKQLNIIEIYL